MNLFHLSPFEIFYLFGAFHGIFLAVILLLSAKSRKGSVYLALLLLLFSFYLFENVMYSSGYIREIPQLYYTTFPLIFLIGPLFYFYVRKSVTPGFSPGPIHFLHFLPFLSEVVLLWPFYRLDSEIKQKIYDASVASTANWTFNIYFFGYVIYAVSACAYFAASYRLAANAKGSSGIPFRWLRQSSIALFGYVALGFILSLLLFANGALIDLVFHSNLLLQTVLIQIVGYTAFAQPRVFYHNGTEKKYKYSSLDDISIKRLSKELIMLMESDRLFLNPELSSESIAEKLGVSKHHLSQVLTEGLKTNFYDFINSFRVRVAKDLLLADKYQNAKITHIALDAGFLHKSTFLRSFRKATGLTPTEFKNLHKKEVPLH